MRILQAFCFLLLAAACASGGALAIGEAAPDPQSSVATSVSTYVDSAAVYQALRGAPEPPAGSDVPPVFTVAFDEQGRLDSIMPALPGLPRAFADSVIRLLQPHVKRQSRTAKKQNAFLYAAGGSEPRIAIHHFVESAPELINAGLIRSLIDQEIRARRTRDPELPHETKTVQIKMIVATDGSTDDVRVGRSSGDLALNRVARRIAGQMRFTPATIEGIAVPVSVTMPISFPF